MDAKYLLIKYRRTRPDTDWRTRPDTGLLIVNPFQEEQVSTPRVRSYSSRGDVEYALIHTDFLTPKYGKGSSLVIGRLEKLPLNIEQQQLFIKTERLRKQHMAIYAQDNAVYLRPLGTRRIDSRLITNPPGVKLGKRTDYWITTNAEMVSTEDNKLVVVSKRVETSVENERRHADNEEVSLELTFEQLSLEELLNTHSQFLELSDDALAEVHRA